MTTNNSDPTDPPVRDPDGRFLGAYADQQKPARGRDQRTPRRINEIAHCKRRITADIALGLARYFGTTDRFWLKLQTRFDLEVEKDHLGNTLDRIEPLQAV